MISRKLSTLTVCALLALSMQCSWRTVANKAENGLGVVRFFNGWSKALPNGRILVLADTNGYVVRRKVSPEPQELIIRMKALITNAEGKSETVFSDEVYAVSLDLQFRVRAATADEWERAEQLENPRLQIRSNRNKAPSEPRHTENAVSYKEKLFVKSGEFWAEPVGLVSPDGKSLAVFSFSSSAKPQTSWSPLDGSLLQEPRPGEMFVDVFDTSSGKRIQSGRARYDGSPSLLFGGALWVTNNYLIVPLDPQNSSDAAGQTCFIGILPPVN